jgi:DNA-binding CsgD family transcriptional regulator
MQLNRNVTNKKPGAKEMLPDGTTIKAPAITKRELDVMLLLCMDHSAKEIAHLLQITHHTVQGYKKSLKRKTGSLSVVGIVIYAIKNKIFPVATVILYFLSESDYWQTFVDSLPG